MKCNVGRKDKKKRSQIRKRKREKNRQKKEIYKGTTHRRTTY